jgi:peptidoglycan/xylan/chitin deacetylase (PgdA/CDA1 family)
MELYTKFRQKLSTKNQGRISRLLVNCGLKPKVNNERISPFKKGIVIFSADFEMAWAFRFSNTKSFQANTIGLLERKNFPRILELFNANNLPVTWATVGHLFLGECRLNAAGIAHEDMPRPDFFKNKNWIFNNADWYKHDPCSDLKNAPGWYAPDLIDQIINSKVNHEIGCHSFSHLDFTYENCKSELADAEITACIKLASAKGIKLKSMVFPGGTEGNFESLVEHRFTCYRKPLKYHIDIPYIDRYGLVAIPSSLSLEKDPFGWSKAFHLKMIRKFLESTIKSKMVCHFWFHPSMNIWYLENILPEVTRMVNEYRITGEINVLTMDQVAQEVIKEKNF